MVYVRFTFIILPYPSSGSSVKAADLDDAVIVGAVRDLPRRHQGRWLMRVELEEAFPEVPPKVLVAKLRKLIRRGLIDGCACGCRGDFTVPDAE